MVFLCNGGTNTTIVKPIKILQLLRLKVVILHHKSAYIRIPCNYLESCYTTATTTTSIVTTSTTSITFAIMEI